MKNQKNLRSCLIAFLLCTFSILIITSLAYAQPSSCPVGMDHYWKMDEAGAPYQDFYGTNNAACTNCPAAVAGIINGAQFFDGINDEMNVADDNSFDWGNTESFSIELWMKTDSGNTCSGNQVFVGRDDSQNSGLQWWVGCEQTNRFAYFALRDTNGTGIGISGIKALNDGAWHHIVAVRDAGTNEIRIYVDGIQEGTTPATYSAGFGSSTAWLNIGYLNVIFPGYHFQGTVDEVALYSRVLSADEISRNYYDGLVGLGLGYCGCDAPVTIMPLGDSITKGVTAGETEDTTVGYRQKLFLDLINTNYTNIDFVGTLSNGALASPSFDIDHEGHEGLRDDEAAANIYNWLVANPAQIVLLHIGTNSFDTSPTDVENILNEIDRYEADYNTRVTVILARIVKKTTYPVTVFNDNVQAMAENRIANGDKIIIVDQENALNYWADFNLDHIHPIASGYIKMADVWLAALETFLPVCQEPGGVFTGVFMTKWGTTGSGNGQFFIPNDAAVDSAGDVYVADAGNNRIQKFTSSGVFITKWGTSGSGNGQFNYPSGVGVDSTGNVYVADTGNRRIQKFTSSGVFITKWGTLGSADGQFNNPREVAVDSAGDVYVADAGNNRIQKFSSSGVFITKWGALGSGNGQFNYPSGVAVDSAGNVYVADTGNRRIQKFSSSGVFITKWGTLGSANGQLNNPRGVAADSAGNVYVADAGNNRIQKFTSSGVFIAKWGTLGSKSGQLNYPNGVAPDNAGNVYVADTGNNRIQRFDSNGAFIAKWGTLGSADGQFSIPRAVALDSSRNIYVVDTDNDRIQKFGYPDNDIDGVKSDLDCNDNDNSIYPGAPEICDYKDNDCDSLVDDADPDVTGQSVWYPDADGDGYGNPAISIQQCTGLPGFVLNNIDYDDSDPNIGPSVKLIGASTSYYLSLQAAYDAASEGDTVRSVAVTITEDLYVDLYKSVTLDGGYNGTFTTKSGVTTLQGNIIDTNGVLTLGDFILQ